MCEKNTSLLKQTNLDLTGSSIKPPQQKKSQTQKPWTKKTITLLPKIFHKSRTSPPHCSQSPWIYNNWPEWECTWQVSGLHLLGLRTHRGFSGMTAHHIQQTATVRRVFIYVTSLCPAEGPSLFLRKCVVVGTEESRQCRNYFQSGSLRAPVCPGETSRRACFWLGPEE